MDRDKRIITAGYLAQGPTKPGRDGPSKLRIARESRAVYGNKACATGNKVGEFAVPLWIQQALVRCAVRVQDDS